MWGMFSLSFSIGSILGLGIVVLWVGENENECADL